MATSDLFLGVKIEAAEIDGSTQDLHDTLTGPTASLKGVLTIDGYAFDVVLVRVSQRGI